MAAVLGLDIGGANLKAAHTDGCARSVPFALWKDPAGLPAALARLHQQMPPADVLALTMTGELCDCFESKRQGVLTILDAVTTIAKKTPIRVWRNDGYFVDVPAARATPLQVASANWLALATFAGRFAPNGAALLIDIGSTTTDIVPLLDGRPVPNAGNDSERLRSRELVYTGVRRTPLCAVLDGGVAAELFATTLDAYLLLGMIAEDATDCNTADGRPATRAAAETRLARMFCADLETCTSPERHQLAKNVLHGQLWILTSALDSVVDGFAHLPQTLVLAGEGEFLARMAVEDQRASPSCPMVSLNQELGADISRAACAHAVAMLAAER